MYQEVGHAFVMPLQGRSVVADDLRAFLKARIANYKVPKDFTIEAALPLLPNGKIDKRALAARLISTNG
jgi:acyl-CoA synthetase (AMP-forming)/AMP-acid ligase II